MAPQLSFGAQPIVELTTILATAPLVELIREARYSAVRCELACCRILGYERFARAPAQEDVD